MLAKVSEPINPIYFLENNNLLYTLVRDGPLSLIGEARTSSNTGPWYQVTIIGAEELRCIDS